MNGAESLVHTLLANGVDTCFANPGTSEMHFVAALDRIPGMRCVLGLFEGVVTGAADGYARMADKPAATLLHCGPGLGNGIANLHNAQRARVPMVNIVGDQATYHRPLDPLLTSDTEGLARAVSVWTRTTMRAERVGADAAAAIVAARTVPGGVATLILPSDASWNTGGVAGGLAAVPEAPKATPEAVAATARLLRAGGAALLLDGLALRERGLAIAERIRAATGCRLLGPTFGARVARGQGRPAVERIPYFVDAAREVLGGLRTMVLAGGPRPAMFFAYPGKDGRPEPEDCAVHVLARPEEDVLDALERLAEAVGAPAAAPVPSRPRPVPEYGQATSESFARTLAALMPEGAVIAEEGISFGFAFQANTHAAPPHDWLQLTGGAIGNGPPLATGAAVGAPGRRVINLQADGSALYTIQALWTQARERLDVTTVIFSNRSYAILQAEYAGVGAVPGATAMSMMQLDDPAMDWVKLAGGFGVEAARAETLEAFADLFTAANRRSGPFLIELMIG